MDKEDLKKRLAKTLTKNEVLELASEMENIPNAFGVLYEISLGYNQKMAFRASWLLENLIINKYNWLNGNLVSFLNSFALQRNSSSMRHFYKILAWVTDAKQSNWYDEFLVNFDWSQIVDLAFEDVLNSNVKVAVKSQILSFILNVSRFRPDFLGALLEVMELLIDKESIAFFAKTKIVKSRIKRIH